MAGTATRLLSGAARKRGAAPHHSEGAYNAMDGYGIGGAEHMVTETLIRAMYDYWRRVMDI